MQVTKWSIFTIMTATALGCGGVKRHSHGSSAERPHNVADSESTNQPADQPIEVGGTLDGSGLPKGALSELEDLIDRTPGNARVPLIVYNRNAIDLQAREVAEYYADRRGFDQRKHLCELSLPVGLYASKDQLMGARFKIHRCLWRMLPEEVTKGAEWDESKIDALIASAPADTLVYIQGIPPRLRWAPWPQHPSFDFYLAASIYNARVDCPEVGCLFRPAVSTAGLDAFQDYWSQRRYLRNVGSATARFSEFAAMPPLDAKLDHMMVYGRIDSFTGDRAKALIRRTLDGEKRGLAGNVVATPYKTSIAAPNPGSTTTVNFLMETVGDQERGPCLDHVKMLLPFDPDQCRTAFEPNGTPAFATGNLPLVPNAAVFFGDNPLWNIQEPTSQTAFRGDFDAMLRWRKGTAECQPLCKDVGNEAQVTACRERSSDYFKELNTDCVGVANGFMGYQLRSFPVQYTPSVGSYPKGFTDDYYYTYGGREGTEAGDSNTQTPPKVILSGGYVDPAIGSVDSRFIAMGEPNLLTIPAQNCDGPHGEVVADCYGLQTTRMAHSQVESSPRSLRVVDGKYRIRFSFSHKERLTENDAAINFNYTFKFSNGRILEGNVAAPIAALAANWTRDSVVLEVPAVVGEHLEQWSFVLVIGQVHGYLALDALRVQDIGQAVVDLLDPAIGDFAAPALDNFAPGDFAIEVMERLGAGESGAVSWYGSSSHHLTGGGAFSNSMATFASLLNGNTLGEAIQLGGKAESGIIIGNPLFSPIAAKISVVAERKSRYYVDEAVAYQPGNYHNWPDTDYLIEDSTYNFSRTDSAPIVTISALQGRGYVAVTRWEVDICSGRRLVDCGSSEHPWRRYRDDVGSVDRMVLPLPADGLLSFVDDLTVSQSLYLRLRVFNPRQERQALFSYVHAKYRSDADLVTPISVQRHISAVDLGGRAFSNFNEDPSITLAPIGETPATAPLDRFTRIMVACHQLCTERDLELAVSTPDSIAHQVSRISSSDYLDSVIFAVQPPFGRDGEPATLTFRSRGFTSQQQVNFNVCDFDRSGIVDQADVETQNANVQFFDRFPDHMALTGVRRQLLDLYNVVASSRLDNDDVRACFDKARMPQ